MRVSDSKGAYIANGQALSTVIDLEAYSAVGFLMPAAWTTANLTFLGSDQNDATTMEPIYDQTGTEFVVTAAAGRAVAILPNASALLPFRYIQIRSGTVGTPVNQAADRAIRVLVRDPEFEE